MYSRKLKLLTIVMLSLTTFFIYKNNNYNNITYTVIGDSYSLGIDSYGIKVYSYGDYVKEYLKDIKKLKEYNTDYIKGDMTIEMLYNTLLTNKKMYQYNTNKNIKEILRETDILTITIGINDLIYKMSINKEYDDKEIDSIINDIELSFNELIKEIRKVYNREIYIIGYYDTNNEKYNQLIKLLNNIYKKNKEVIYISPEIINQNKEYFFSNSNSNYPNYKGYSVISSKIIDKISKKLEK